MNSSAAIAGDREPELPAIVSREDLYALVWSEPMSRLARRFGLSDVGLAKACRRMMIPVPGHGFWGKEGGWQGTTTNSPSDASRERRRG
jgi:hypothetical protein